MKIKNITTQIEYIPLKTPFITALREVKNVEFVRVKVQCDNGFIALGEAPATMAITGEDLEIITNSINSIKNKIISCSPQDALTILHNSKIGSSAKAAVDMALISLLAQDEKKELHEYLGAKEKVEIKTDITISLNPTETMLEDAKEAYQNGHDILKIKLGSDINHAIQSTKKLSLELPKAKLLIDANQAWSLKDTLIYLNAIKDIKIELLEQPVNAKDIASLKTITQSTKIPLLADEAAFSLEDVKKIVQTKSADMINIKLMKCGGLSKAVEILEYAREKGVKCMLGSMLEGPVSIDVAYALAQAYMDVIEYVDLDSPLLYKDV